MSATSSVEETVAAAQPSGVDAKPQTVDPADDPVCATENLTDKKETAKPVRGRKKKRGYNTATETSSAESHAASSPRQPAAKRPAATDRVETGSAETATEQMSEADRRHAHDPQYASNMAPQIYAFFHKYEKSVLPGTHENFLNPKEYPSLGEKRTQIVNAMFELSNKSLDDPRNKVATDTMHLALHYFDRFVELYAGTENYTLENVMATCLFLASKYEDVDPITPNTILLHTTFGKKVTEKQLLSLEPLVVKVVNILMCPVSTTFAHRYLQVCNLEEKVSAVHTARYLCAVAGCHYPLTGYLYSQIAAAAVFISYNKYMTASSGSVEGASVDTAAHRAEFPAALLKECGHQAKDLRFLITEIVKVAKELESVHNKPISSRLRSERKKDLPVDVYQYYRNAGVVSTAIVPDFQPLFDQLFAEETGSCSEKESEVSKPDSEDGSPPTKENAEGSEAN